MALLRARALDRLGGDCQPAKVSGESAEMAEIGNTSPPYTNHSTHCPICQGHAALFLQIVEYFNTLRGIVGRTRQGKCAGLRPPLLTRTPFCSPRPQRGAANRVRLSYAAERGIERQSLTRTSPRRAGPCPPLIGTKTATFPVIHGNGSRRMALGCARLTRRDRGRTLQPPPAPRQSAF